MNSYISTILRFAGLVLIQVLVLNKVQFSGYFNPYVYILFLLVLPVSIPSWALLLYGFFLGLSVDVFSGVMGLHTSAAVLLAFLRPMILKSTISAEDLEEIHMPGLWNLGVGRFLSYATLAVLVHHIFLFVIEVYSFQGFADTLLRALINSLISLVFIFIILILFTRSKNV